MRTPDHFDSTDLPQCIDCPRLTTWLDDDGRCRPCARLHADKQPGGDIYEDKQPMSTEGASIFALGVDLMRRGA